MTPVARTLCIIITIIKERKMRLLFTGDINFRGMPLQSEDEYAKILEEVMPYAESADYIIPNLECPLAEEGKYSPIKKSGPPLLCDPGHVKLLKAFGADAVTLANNHIGDFGDGALYDTLSLLRAENILYAGAGKDISEAYEAVRFEKGEVSASIISVCENEFGIATEKTPGSAVYNSRRLFKRIKEEKEKSKYVIVVFHGGCEFNPLPSPDAVDRYRFIIDMGADAVVGGHTHCPEGYEYYMGKPIVYSMGNFLFKSLSDLDKSNSWFYGYMTLLDLSNGVKLEIIPYSFDTEATRISVFTGNKLAKMTTYINKISNIIQDSELLYLYFKGWTWKHKHFPSFPVNYDSTEKCAPNYNLVKCESHHSKTVELAKIFFAEEFDLAKEWEKRISELQIINIED